MQKRDKKTKNTEKHVNAIKDDIFVDFCKDINVPDIRYYEKNNWRYVIFNLVFIIIFNIIL